MNNISKFMEQSFHVESPTIQYTKDEIISEYSYDSIRVEGTTIKPCKEKYTIKTKRHVPKVGVMIIGLGGNNGSTFTAGILANKHNITWNTKEGLQKPNYYGSITQASTVRIGTDETGQNVYIPFKNLLPMLDPNNIVIGGWDISSLNLADAMERAKVLNYDLQMKLKPYLSKYQPLPSIYYPDFIAANQTERADNILQGTDKQKHLEMIRQHIREFKSKNKVDKMILLWSANTERYVDIIAGINDTSDNLLQAIKKSHPEISPSTIFAVASILEGCSYINGSPQNTLVPGVIELAEKSRVFIAGDDFKSGQTKIKSVLVDFLISAGIKPVSIVSYNHLGNNDGRNLSAPQQFRSKEISKSNVVDDMVESNGILYKKEESPDHTIVIKYVPYVGDSKRAMDEYTSEIFLGGKNTIALHNVCEDSLLATPLMIDLIIICELAERIELKRNGEKEFEKLHSVLCLLSYMLKAPVVPNGTPVVNALFAQKECIVNLFRACLSLPPENYMQLENKLHSVIDMRSKHHTGSKNKHGVSENGGIQSKKQKVEKVNRKL